MGERAGPRQATGSGTERHRAFLDATLPHLDAVHRFARHASRDPQLAEDLVQETYLHAYAAFDGLRDTKARAWLLAICLNLVRSDWRRRRRRPDEQLTGSLGSDGGPAGAAERDGAGGRSGPEGDDVFAVVQANLSREAVSRALAELPDEQRLALVLMDLAGHTASEVGELLGCPRGTVLSRAHRGRRRLAEILVEQGADHDLR